MSDVAKLEAELELAKLCEELETARDLMHADREDEDALAEYNEASNKVAAARAAFREAYPPDVPPSESPDGVATVDSIDVTGEVKP